MKKCFVQNRKWKKNKNLHNLVKRPIHVLIYLHAVLSLVKMRSKVSLDVHVVII